MRKKMNKRATRKAFTLVELVIVIAVIGILASVLIPTFASVINSAKDNASIQQATNARDEYITTYLISPEEAIGLLIETPRDWFIVNKSCEVEKINIEDYDLNQYEKLPDIPTIKDVHIYRKRNTDIYTITFLVRDGNIVGNKKVYTMYNLDKMYSDYELTQESTIPTAEGNKIGYNSVFLGWQYGNAEVGVLVINADGTFTNENIKSIFKDGKFNVESDINLYAKFERTPIEYTIHYELDDGTNNEDNPLTYTIEDEIVLKDATKQNYTFKGWYTDREFNGSPITKIAKGTTNDITLYAKFVEGEESTYKVEYYQENIENEEYTLFETVSDLVGATGETVTADIKTYEGFTQNTEKIAEASGQVIFDGSLVLKVYYNRNIYTITWNIDGDTSNTEPYKYGAMPTYKGETPTKEQDNLKTYTFKTWSPTIEEVKGEQTYTARFEETARKYDVIIYDINKVEKLRRVYSCDTEFDLTTINLEQEGYEFLGLTTEENIGTTNYVTKIAVGEWGEKKFYANYKAVTYTITYILDNGTNNSANPNTYNIETETIILLDATRQGYTFNGWYKEETFINKVETIEKGSIGNITLYARFIASDGTLYTIEHYQQNLENNEYTLKESEPLRDITDITVTAKTKDYEGFTFDNDNENNVLSGTVKADGSLVLKVYYNRNTYTITWSINETTSTETYRYGATPTHENPTKAQDNGYTYTFNGWTPAIATVTVNATYTAQFTPTARTYTITYNTNGGSSVASETYTYNVEKIITATTSKTGYTFDGWYAESGLTTKVTSITKGSYGDKTLYAKFTIETYFITYILDSGINNNANPDTYNVETETITLLDATRQGYTFIGWYKEETFINKVETIEKGSTGDITLYARFIASDGTLYTIEHYQQNLENNEYTLKESEPLRDITDTTVTAKTKDYEGFTFDNDNENNVLSGTVKADGSLVLKVYYNRNTYTITWSINGATSTQTYRYGATPTHTTPTKAQDNGYTYTFSGWTPAIATVTANATYTAQFTPTARTYAITYNTNGGSSVASETYTYNVEKTITATTSKTGYTFEGWYAENGLTTKVTSITKGTYGDKTLYAKFTVVTYTITYTLNGGTNNSANPSNYNIETATITLLDATRQGYTFNGWYLENTYNTQVTTITKGSTGNKVLYAKFTANTNTKYIVQHYQQNLNDNNYTLKDTENLTGTTDTIVNATAKSYTGFTEDTANTNRVVSGTVKADESLVLKVYYNRNTYTITWSINGATSTETYKYGATPTHENPTKAQDNGYTYAFSGWTPAIATVTANATYTAQFTSTARTYTITYNTNGGSSVASETYTYNVEKTITATTSKTGYTFDGWYAESGLTTKVTSITKGSYGDKTLYAKFTVVTYTITYTLNGGTNNSANPSSYNIETATITLLDATRQGYTFNGWYSDSTFKTKVTTITKGSTGNKVLYAKFTANTNTKYIVQHYQQNLNDNNYTLKETENLTGTTDTIVNATAKSYTGFTEDTANTNRVLSGTVKADGSLVLKVYYNRNTYTITWSINGATSTQTYRYGATPTHTTPTKAQDNGYTYAFSGWTPAIATVTANATYTAQFTPTARTYTITYNTNGGSSVASETYTYNVEKTITATTSKTGYTFDGWYAESGLTTKVTSITKGTYGDKTLYAKFTVASYKITYTLNGGTNNSANPSNYNVETATITLKDAAKDGCTFDGWYSDSTFKTKVTTIVKGSTGNKVLYAKFVDFTTEETNGQLTITGYTGSDTNVVVPSTINGKSIVTIGGSAFYETDVEYVTIPDSVTVIEDEAFSSCISLKGITLSKNIKEITSSLFVDCSSLLSVDIPSGVTAIRDCAFSGCTSLNSVTIPNTVTEINYDAFLDCSSLTKIVIPASVKILDTAILEGCTSLTSIVVENGNTKYDSRNNCNAIIETATNKLIIGCKATIIPDSVILIGNYSFDRCTSLTSIVIPNSVTSIGDCAFRECTSLTSIIIPNSVTSIVYGAFYSCSNLTNVTISSGVTSIGVNAFYGCSKLTSATFKGPNHWKVGNTSISASDLSNTSTAATCLKSTYSSNFWTKDISSMYTTTESNGVLTITGYTGSDTDITIPSIINGKNVIAIGDNAFQNKDSLTSVVISKGIESIGSCAFQSMGECGNLADIVIPNTVTSIGSYAFQGCVNLTQIDLPDSLTSIGDGAFSYCGDLTSITIPNSVISIGVSAFEECGKLTEVNLPNNLKVIEEHLFTECSSLTNIDLPDSLTSIGGYSFDGCRSLTNITIPNNVTTIGMFAFDNCASLTDIVFENTNGWTVTNSSGSSQKINSSILSDSKLSVTYLTKIYVACTLTRV